MCELVEGRPGVAEVVLRLCELREEDVPPLSAGSTWPLISEALEKSTVKSATNLYTGGLST